MTPADLVVLVPIVCVVSCLLPFLLRHAIRLLRLETNYSASGLAASSPLHKHRPRPMSSEAAAPHLVASPSPLPVDGVSPHLLRLQSILLAPLDGAMADPRTGTLPQTPAPGLDVPVCFLVAAPRISARH